MGKLRVCSGLTPDSAWGPCVKQDVGQVKVSHIQGLTISVKLQYFVQNKIIKTLAIIKRNPPMNKN